MAKQKKKETKKLLDVIKNRYTFFAISWALVLFSLISFFALNINLWIDMTGWTQSEYSYTWEVDLEEVRADVKTLADKVNQTDKKLGLWEVESMFKTL